MSIERGIFERRFRNSFDALSGVTAEALRFLEKGGAGDKAVYLANLAVEELGTNIIKYGYDDSGPHEILLRLEIQPQVLSLLLEDDGHPFNPLDAPEPNLNQSIDQRVPGGLGIHLVRKLIPDIQYHRVGHRNQITIQIPL